MTKLVIFDMDGVLVDSKDVWYRAWKHVYSLFNEELSLEVFEKCCWGATFYVFCRKRNLSKKECSRALDALYKSYLDNADKVKLFPGVTELFAELEKKGIKKALLTNTHKWVIEGVVSRLGLGFDYMPDMSGMEPKPDPAGIFRICKELGIKKDDTVFVGDTGTDVETGKNAGVRTLIVGRDVANIREILEKI